MQIYKILISIVLIASITGCQMAAKSNEEKLRTLNEGIGENPHDMIDRMNREITVLKSENENLRSSIAGLSSEVERLKSETVRMSFYLAAFNAVTSQNEVLAKTKVNLQSKTGTVWSMVTDANGLGSFHIPAGQYTMTVEGYRFNVWNKGIVDSRTINICENMSTSIVVQK